MSELIVDKYGAQRWYKDDKLHRDDIDPVTGETLPAIIFATGGREWYKNGKLHRDDEDPITGETLPAIIFATGGREWYKDDKLHRDDIDPVTGETLPAIIYASGSKEWYTDGKLHRDDKDPVTGETLPAVIYANGSKEWYIKGKRIYPKKVYTHVPHILHKYSEYFLKEMCYNNGISYITHEELKDISDNDILLLPVSSISSDNVNIIKYHCYTREEVNLWWKGKPDRTHPTTRVPLTNMEKNMIVTFMDDDTFFGEIA